MHMHAQQKSEKHCNHGLKLKLQHVARWRKASTIYKLNSKLWKRSLYRYLKYMFIYIYTHKKLYKTVCMLQYSVLYSCGDHYSVVIRVCISINMFIACVNRVQALYALLYY
jgi:hypothetical protein